MMEAIENGDDEAEKIWLKSVKGLATAICSFSNILDPEAVILGGGIAKAGDRLFVPLREYLDPLLWKTDDYEIKLLPAQLGDLAGAYGAAAQRAERLNSKQRLGPRHRGGLAVLQDRLPSPAPAGLDVFRSVVDIEDGRTALAGALLDHVVNRLVRLHAAFLE